MYLDDERWHQLLAMRAEQPVPQGERSIFPGRIATALAPVRMPSSTLTGAAI